MSAQHTQGPLQVHGSHLYTADPERAMVAQVFNPGSSASDYPLVANARRLAACWNALQGIPTSLLESVPINLTSTEPYLALQAQRDALLAALHPFVCFSSSAETITITVRQEAA
jgi:hypothetical protein